MTQQKTNYGNWIPMPLLRMLYSASAALLLLFTASFVWPRLVAVTITIKVLGRDLRVHDLRHSHASFLINNGVDILLISKRLGHSNTAMTLNVYSHLYPDRENEAINLINKLKANK